MGSIKSNLRRVRNGLAQWVFETGQRFRVDILPRHFYSSIPDLRELRRNPAAWRYRSSMVGVPGADVDSQLAFAVECCAAGPRERLGRFDIFAHATAENGSPGYGPVEAEFLYCFIAAHRPRRVVQVGAGAATAVMLKAAEDAGYPLEVVCVDPYPTPLLTRAERAGKIKLFAQPAQVVDLSVLTDLGEGGFLFVDSTHTVKAGSEVNRIVLEVLPRLAKGSFVHFHDIFFPFDYSRALFREPFFNVETTLLHAYLAENRRYTMRASLAMLHYDRAAELQKLIPRYKPAPDEHGLHVEGGEGDFPSAVYLEVVA